MINGCKFLPVILLAPNVSAYTEGVTHFFPFPGALNSGFVYLTSFCDEKNTLLSLHSLFVDFSGIKKYCSSNPGVLFLEE